MRVERGPRHQQLEGLHWLQGTVHMWTQSYDYNQGSPCMK